MTIYVIMRLSSEAIPTPEAARLTHEEAKDYLDEHKADTALRVIFPVDMPLRREAPRIMAGVSA